MSFKPDFFQRASVELQNPNGNAPKMYTYVSSTDTLATIAASGYFNYYAQYNRGIRDSLSIGDIIWAAGSDAGSWLRITAIEPNITISQDVVPPGSIDTADLANDAVTNAKIADNAVSLENLDSGVTPSHVIRFAGQPTTAGGAAAEAITVTGAAATDLAFVQMVDDGTNDVTIVNAVVTTNTLTVTFSADPGNDAVINYQIINAAS